MHRRWCASMWRGRWRAMMRNEAFARVARC
jgi:hypothetical protein